MTRIGLIGAGRMGNNHAGHFKHMKNVSLSGVFDINPEHARKFASEYGSKIYSSAEELASSPEIDMLVICSPTYAHIEGIRTAVAAHKPIFCEKPLCRTREQLEEIEKLLGNYDRFFALGYVRRYSATTRCMKLMIDEGKIGKILCAEVHVLFGQFARLRGDWFADYSKCGGVMLDMIAHHLDLLNMMLGKIPETMYAKALMLSEKLELPCDFVSATAGYGDGSFANLTCSWMRSGPGGNAMTIYGEKGALTLSDSDGLIFHTPGKNEKIDVSSFRLYPVENEKDDFFESELRSIADSVESGRAPVVTFRDAANAMKVCLAMMKSAEEGNIEKVK